MKLYCVHVLHKNVDTGDVKIFKSESDLSSFEYFQRSTIQQFMTHTSKILVERSGLEDRNSVKEGEYQIHCYVRNDGLSATCVTDAEYQQRVAMSFLERVLDDFTNRIPSVQWAVIEGEQDCPYPGLKELLERWQHIPEAGPVTRFHILNLPKWILSTIWNIIASYIYE
ncbi:unnamed protein product [Caenorhabditis brenneri]